MADTPYTNPDRHYRRTLHTNADEQKIRFCAQQTDLLLTVPLAASREDVLTLTAQTVTVLRAEIQLWSELLPEFRHSLMPIPCPDNAPEIVTAMCIAAHAANVGPFAAVAGAIAQRTAEAAARYLEQHHLPRSVIVENGGDTYLISERERIVALLPDPCSAEQIGIILHPEDFPVSLCASSATIGHSLSFGKGELVMVRSQNAALADAFATAYCNTLHKPSDIDKLLSRAQIDHAHTAGFGSVDAVFAQCGGQIGLWGNMELTVVKENTAPEANAN